MRGSNQRRSISVWISACLAASVYGTTWAAGSTAASEDTGLEEITVTAQRRSENLQKVPIAVNVVSGASMAEQGADTTNLLSAAIPNLNTTGSFNSNIYIRGVGANSASSMPI